ncbi:hypothetical protein QFC21_005624 [Naganishia friedmannii]|uniref:Uncharacterized protein n=1 Tax=Naganishia friedmannii TaxID=89922 RepID=A0ACC2V7B8_9TREE|nr:hypothetical protein QFC21_005624 [Naganishia friedmannii]
MNPLTYGGDEVSALVLDFGTQNTRAGYAGEEIPRCIVPTAYGYMDVEAEVPVESINTTPSAVEDITMNGNGSTANEGTGESVEATKPSEEAAEKTQDEQRQEKADKADDMDGIEEESKTGEDGDGKPAETTEQPGVDTPIKVAEDTRLSPSERQRQGSPAQGNGSTGTTASKPSQPTMKKVRQKRFYVGEEGVNVWRTGMEVGNMMTDGIITEAEPLPHLISHILHDKLGVDPSEHALMVTEPAWNTPRARETLAEIAFEGEGVPAFYIACNAVLSAMTFLESQIEATLRQSNPNITFTPHHYVKGRTPVALDQPAQVVLNQQRIDKSTASWRSYAEQRVVQDWKESVCEVSPFPYEPHSANRQSKFYEFPDGYNHYYGNERYQLPEMLFKPETFVNKAVPIPSRLGSTPESETSHSLSHIVGLADLVHNSIFALDVDQRAALLQNIVVIGGGSFMPGLTDRLNFELAQRIPGSKIKIHSPGNSIERKYSAWLGGSILASLGTFHQLWVGQDEWKEHGANILRQLRSIMSSLPLSPPLNPSRRHTAPLPNNRKGEDQSRIRPELPAKLKPHALAKSSTRVSTNAVFKMPALPVPRSTTSQAAANNAQATTVVSQNRSPVPINQSLPCPSLDENAPSPAADSMASDRTQKTNPPHGMIEGSGSGSRSRTTGQQAVGAANLLKENVAKDLGCENEAQMELHQRVNKHVNTYLKKACGIAGGYKLYTERQAWKVLSTLAPLDLATNPEVFEPLETDQLAKFLNLRRRSLEEFQEAKMPMPPLPLLPSTTPTDYMTDAQRENAKLSFQWGYQGVVNRGKWTITQSDLAMIKSELISLQKARKRFEGLPPMVLQLPPSEEIEVILSRVAIRKTTRYAYSTSQGNGSPSIQPLKNSVKDFREMKNTYKLLPVDDTLDEMDTILGPNKLKVTDVCNLSLSITREEINMVKEELQQVAARKRIGPEQRMRNVVLSSSWERSSEEVLMNLNVKMEQYCLSPPLAPLKKDATTTQAPLREVLHSINVSSTASLLRTSRHNTPTLAASSSVDEDTSSLPASPTSQGARIAKECQDSISRYQGPVMDAWEEEKLGQ